jgi:hypothetical protein
MFTIETFFDPDVSEMSRAALAWFEYKGLIVVRTKRSHGNKDLPENLIRQQLKVHESQFSGLISCSVSKDDYVEILKAKGLIPAPAVQQSPKLAP